MDINPNMNSVSFQYRSSVGGGGDEGDRGALALAEPGLFLLLLELADLLHLEHPLHDELVLALLVRVPLVLALPREVELLGPALVQRDQEVGALVAVRDRDPVLDHFLLRRDHRLRRSQLHPIEIRHWRALKFDRQFGDLGFLTCLLIKIDDFGGLNRTDRLGFGS